MDGEPQQRTNFLSDKIAITVLYHSLNAAHDFTPGGRLRSFIQESIRERE